MRPMMDRMYLNLLWMNEILKTYSNVKNTIQHRSMTFNTGCKTCTVRSTVDVIVEFNVTLNDEVTSYIISVFLKLGRLSARNEKIDTATTQRDTIPYTLKKK